jgi:acyl-CoA thioesterase-1
MISSYMSFSLDHSSRSGRLALAGAVAALAALAGCSRTTPVPAETEPPVAATTAPVPAPEPPRETPGSPRPKIVAFGDSLTAGFGLEKSQSYPALLQRMLDERGYNYEVVNAGYSGETSAGGLRRIDKALAGDVRVVIVELGGNDGLRGLPPRDLKKNLAQIIEKAKARGALVLLAGMQAPPQLGAEYTSEFRQVYAELGREQRVPVMPFFLEGVAGDPSLNQMDGIHPNRRGAEVVAENVLEELEPLLEK